MENFSRTQIYLTAAQQAALASLAQEQGSSASALIREAVNVYIAQHQPASKTARRKAAAGAWKKAEPGTPSLSQLRQEERKF